MGDFFKVIGACILCLVLILAMSWIFSGNDFFLYKFFAPKQEAVRREVVETSKAFNDGMIQELQSMQIDYVKGTDSQKDAISSIVVHRYSNYNDRNLGGDLRSFVSECKSRQMNSK